jgi:hypothetical protein
MRSPKDASVLGPYSVKFRRHGGTDVTNIAKNENFVELGTIYANIILGSGASLRKVRGTTASFSPLNPTLILCEESFGEEIFEAKNVSRRNIQEPVTKTY